MERKANVLVIGNSGVGKSTLINSIFGSERAVTGLGEAVTTQMEVYDNEVLPFRIIDSIGFEYGFLKQRKAIGAVVDWSKKSIKEDARDKQIDLIWYCVDATSRKMFGKNIEMLAKAVKIWKDAPVLVVLTKSYSTIEDEDNKQMVRVAFSKFKKINLKDVVSVVAQPYQIDEDVIVGARGITELIERTNELLPEAMQLNEVAVTDFKLKQKRMQANALTATATVAAATVGAVPIPFADAAILTPLELGVIKLISKIYNVPSNSSTGEQLIKGIVEMGTVSMAARGVISGLKAIPVLNLGTSVLNAIVAGAIMAAVGEATIYIMERIYLGEKDAADLDWAKKVVESEIGKSSLGSVQSVLKEVANVDKLDKKMLAEMIAKIISKNKKQ